MNNKYLDEIRKNFLKNFLIVILCGFFGCTALIVEKNYTTDYVVKTDRAYVMDIVQFSTGETNVYEDLFDYKGLLLTSYNLNQFANSDEVDFSQLNANWNKMSKDQKLKWLSDVIKVNSFKDGVCEIGIDFSKNTPKNMEYMQTNSNVILQTFENTSLKTLQMVKPTSSAKIINHTEVLPEKIMLPKDKILLKYGIIGFMLGAIIAMLGILVRTAGRLK